MKIGIDLHGVADKYPAIVKPCLKAVRSLGIEVIFLSGPPHIEVRKELSKLGYIPNEHYDGIISVVDWLHSKNIRMWKDHKDTWWCDEKDWWTSKANICKEERITVIVDDCAEFESHFGPEVTFILVGHEEIATHKTMRQWIQRELDNAWAHNAEVRTGKIEVLRQLLDFLDK